jgi:hypothetical protein
VIVELIWQGTLVYNSLEANRQRPTLCLSVPTFYSPRVSQCLCFVVLDDRLL